MLGVKGLELLAAATGLAVAIGTVQVHAVTVMSNGGSYNLLGDTHFVFELSTASNAGQDFGIRFFIDDADKPQPGRVVNFTVTGAAFSPSMVWASDDLVYSSPGYVAGPGQSIFAAAAFSVIPPAQE